MKWFITANRLNHVDFYRWDGKDLTLVQRVATSRTPNHLWIDSRSTTVYSTMHGTVTSWWRLTLPPRPSKWRVKTGPMPADVYGSPDAKHLLWASRAVTAWRVFDISGREAISVKRIKTGNECARFSCRWRRAPPVCEQSRGQLDQQDRRTPSRSSGVPGGLIAWMFLADGRYIYVMLGTSCPWWTQAEVVRQLVGQRYRQIAMACNGP